MVSLSAEIIANGTTYEIRNLSSIEFSGQDRSDPSLPSWGIQSNSGSLELYDADGSILKLHKDGMLANSFVKIYLNAKNRKKQIGGFYINDANTLGEQSAKIQLDFQDLLPLWQNKQMPRYYYPYKPNIAHLKFILDAICENAGIEIKMDQKTQTYLENMYIERPNLESASLWSQFNAICEVSFCYIYCDENGIPNIHYSGGT